MSRYRSTDGRNIQKIFCLALEDTPAEDTCDGIAWKGEEGELNESMSLPLVTVVGGVAGSLILLAAAAILHAIRKHCSRSIHADAAELRTQKLPDDSLFPLLQPNLVPMEEIATSRGYGPVLHLVQSLIGLQPTCDMALEIWPPAFECYNLTVPNLLNLPQVLLGIAAAPKDLVSIAMYASSRANGCAYCSSHCCSFAARRGVDPDVLRRLLEDVDASRSTASAPSPSSEEDTERQARRSVVRVAHGLGTVPASLTADDVSGIYGSSSGLSEDQVEWIVAACAMFGSFNKLMDGLGVPLESGAYEETVGIMDERYRAGKAGALLSPTDPTDTAIATIEQGKQGTVPPSPPPDDWTLVVAFLYQAIRPNGAIWLDSKLHGDTPATIAGCMTYLHSRFGCTFGVVLGNLKQTRIARAVTAIIGKNLDASVSTLGIKHKIVAGIQFARHLENDRLVIVLEQVLKTVAAGGRRGDEKDNGDDDERMTAMILKITKRVSFTPNRVTPRLVQEIRDFSSLTAPMLVELVSFLAMIQMIHRIEVFYHVKHTIPMHAASLHAD